MRWNVHDSVLAVVSCPASSRVTSSSRMRCRPTRGSASCRVEPIRRDTTSSPPSPVRARRSATRWSTMRWSSLRARRNRICFGRGTHMGTLLSVTSSNIAWSCTASNECPIELKAPRSASSRVRPSTPRLSEVISWTTSTGSPPVWDRSRSTRFAASLAMIPSCWEIRLFWKTGWIILRCLRHRSPSLVSSPSPMARRACTRPTPLW